MLTRRMRSVLLCIQDFQDANGGASPSLNDMRRRLGLLSKGHVHRTVGCLVDRGYIKLISKDYGKPSDIVVLKPIVAREDYFVWSGGKLVPFQPSDQKEPAVKKDRSIMSSPSVL